MYTGQAPYTYNWSNGATSQDLSNIPAGTYTVTVTGANQCTTTAEVTVTNNNPPINISATMNRTTFDAMWQRTSKTFNTANLGEVIGILQEYFGPEKFTLASLFADENIKIIREITNYSLASAETSFRNVYYATYKLKTGGEKDGVGGEESD